jgi:hypothetical protein
MAAVLMIFTGLFGLDGAFGLPEAPQIGDFCIGRSLNYNRPLDG